jgi:cell division inhibitor SulA
MTAILEKAFAKASNLPNDLQKLLAEQLLEDIAAESKWDKTLANSQKLLEEPLNIPNISSTPSFIDANAFGFL